MFSSSRFHSTHPSINETSKPLTLAYHLDYIEPRIQPLLKRHRCGALFFGGPILGALGGGSGRLGLYPRQLHQRVPQQRKLVDEPLGRTNPSADGCRTDSGNTRKECGGEGGVQGGRGG